MDNFKEKFLNKRSIFIILGLIIIVEVAWASWSLFPSSSPSVGLLSQPPFFKKPTAINLSTNTPEVKVGEKFTVAINLSSDKKTDGADLIINYDPSALNVDVSASSQPVALGNLYSDYPVNTLDPKLGKITVSGISNINSGVVADGLFGSINFVAKKAGPTSIFLDFTKGSTVDTNVTGTEEAADILESVNKLEVKILP